jgi:hypothetical protein
MLHLVVGGGEKINEGGKSNGVGVREKRPKTVTLGWGGWGGGMWAEQIRCYFRVELEKSMCCLGSGLYPQA